MKIDFVPKPPSLNIEACLVGCVKYCPFILHKTVMVLASLSTLIGLARDTPSTSSAAALEAVLVVVLATLVALLELAVLPVLFVVEACPPQPAVNTIVAQSSTATKVFFVFILISSIFIFSFIC